MEIYYYPDKPRFVSEDNRHLLRMALNSYKNKSEKFIQFLKEKFPKIYEEIQKDIQKNKLIINNIGRD